MSRLFMQLMLRFLIFVFALGACSPVSASAEACPPSAGVALQVLGSGGPIADDGRASAGYLVWVDGKSRVLIDAGGGTFLRFAEAGADFGDLDFVGLSHFHADHTADFAALLKSGNFSNRGRALTVSGPDRSEPFPGLSEFLTRLLNPESGVFAYLSGYLDGSRGLPKLAIVEVDSDITASVTVYGDGTGPLQVDALHVPHGIVPALAFRVRAGDHSIVFASDQNGSKPEFIEFAREASLLVMHMPVPEGVSGVGRRLHAPPGVIGAIANDAGVMRLIISHLMQRSLSDLDRNVAAIQTNFSGALDIASDLSCYTLDHQET